MLKSWATWQIETCSIFIPLNAVLPIYCTYRILAKYPANDFCKSAILKHSLHISTFGSLRIFLKLSPSDYWPPSIITAECFVNFQTGAV